MNMFGKLAQSANALESQINGSRYFHPGRELLKRVELHLFLQVSGENASEPLIEGGYFGLNYKNALGICSSLMTMIEAEENIKAIQAGVKQPFSFGYKH